MKTRKTKQSQIDELKAALAERNAWAAKHIQAGDDKIKELKGKEEDAYQVEYSARWEITKALELLQGGCNPALTWPQIYVQLGKLIQIKELYYPKKEKASYPTAC